MIRREGSDRHDALAAALDAYRAAAHAEADAHFDEHALENQRLRILQRIDQAGQPARVLRFPGAMAGTRTTGTSTRRWISIAAAAGLLVGLVTGELLHIVPSDGWRSRTADSRTTATAPGPAGARMRVVPALATTSIDAENALLDAIDMAVQSRGVSELRVVDDLTFAYEPR